jgi:hypothetical protein
MNDIQPYPTEGLNTIYNLLFCDDSTLYQSANAAAGIYPWNILFSAAPTAEELNRIITAADTETRVKILAYRKLSAAGHQVTGKELLGVIVEVGLEEGLDTLAAYKDGTARYINHSGKMTVWETSTTESDNIIQQLFATSEEVVKQIGPWTDARRPAPQAGDIRLSFLVSDGLYFGEGPFEVLEKDAMGGPVIHSALLLLQFLAAQTS